MIITKLIGGLGNQMFQYSAGFALADKYDSLLKLDIYYLLDKSKRHYRFAHRDYALDIFKISGEIATENDVRRHVVPRKGNKYLYHLKRKIIPDRDVFDEESLSCLDDYSAIPSIAYIQGYWQNIKYIKGIEYKLKQEFVFREELPDSHSSLCNEIRQNNSVCVVFRRGDYVGHPILDILQMDYYEKALEIMVEKVEDPVFYVFSDDIPWCQANFRPEGKRVVFVDQKYTGPKAQYYLMLMKECKHHIIPNSTYPWWGAWLCENRSKVVVAPKKWYKGQAYDRNEILMDDWIAI